MSMQERVLAEMPIELTKFLGSLTDSELNEVAKISPVIIAKVYQAGAVFAIDMGIKEANLQAKEDK